MIPVGTTVSYLVGTVRKTGRVLVYIDPQTVLVSEVGDVAKVRRLA